jgi:hypothetical protein
VETPDGIVVASDAFFYYENVEDDRPLGINESLQEIQSAYARARQADHLMPLYDPKVYERFPGGVISAIQPLRESPR